MLIGAKDLENKFGRFFIYILMDRLAIENYEDQCSKLGHAVIGLGSKYIRKDIAENFMSYFAFLPQSGLSVLIQECEGENLWADIEPATSYKKLCMRGARKSKIENAIVKGEECGVVVKDFKCIDPFEIDAGDCTVFIDDKGGMDELMCIGDCVCHLDGVNCVASFGARDWQNKMTTVTGYRVPSILPGKITATATVTPKFFVELLRGIT
jgi:hypothetical protein